ncbi:unnamed protein product [Lactuca saligna]|uniref:Uncharacterized protein n=1 Tax=Lactuca saligna TaxID=75948 RepID=A0AA35Y8W6_LACSI|nr:unnamed protein product [Lactuca saligna]
MELMKKQVAQWYSHQKGIQVVQIIEDMVEKGSEMMDVRNKDEACIQVYLQNPMNYIDNVRVEKLVRGGAQSTHTDILVHQRLAIQQDDKYGTDSVSSEVISNMRVMMKEDSNNAGQNHLKWGYLFVYDATYRSLWMTSKSLCHKNILKNILELKQEDMYYIRDMWKGYQLLGCSQIMGLMARLAHRLYPLAKMVELVGGHLVSHERSKEVNEALPDLIRASVSKIRPFDWPNLSPNPNTSTSSSGCWTSSSGTSSRLNSETDNTNSGIAETN